jgi:hypothetical protein
MRRLWASPGGRRATLISLIALFIAVGGASSAASLGAIAVQARGVLGTGAHPSIA